MPRTLRELVVRARDLDTNSEESRSLQVLVESGDQAKRLALIGAVESEYPHARVRTYANDAASFLDGKVLVVAHLGPILAREQGTATAPQPALFEDVA